MNKLNGLSLFSSAGIGELSIHKKMINFKIANELVESRAKCYEHFYPEVEMINGDITLDEVKSKIIEKSVENKVNFLLATPPCQGLSSVGKNKTQSHFEVDERNFLIFHSFDIIDSLDLDFIIIENVPRFLKMYFPFENEFLLLEDILYRKYSKKYTIEIDVLNAKDYGVGQSRPRAIIKLFKKHFSWPWPQTQKEITLSESIGHLPSLEPGENSNIKWHNAKKVRPNIAESMSYTEPGKSALLNEVFYPKKENGERIKGFHNTYKRMVWDKPAPARTTYSGSISSHNNAHPGRKLENNTYSDPRVLTLLETFIVSSIRPEINFPDNLSESFIRTIIGEAIPPKMLLEICSTIQK